jgi:hypothetical protein
VQREVAVVDVAVPNLHHLVRRPRRTLLRGHRLAGASSCLPAGRPVPPGRSTHTRTRKARSAGSCTHALTLTDAMRKRVVVKGSELAHGRLRGRGCRPCGIRGRRSRLQATKLPREWSGVEVRPGERATREVRGGRGFKNP